MWQIPLGNTVMRAENNTWDHFQDNKVQSLLGDLDPNHAWRLRQRGCGRVPFRQGR
jgi:hypothetical protein